MGSLLRCAIFSGRQQSFSRRKILDYTVRKRFPGGNGLGPLVVPENFEGFKPELFIQK